MHGFCMGQASPTSVSVSTVLIGSGASHVCGWLGKWFEFSGFLLISVLVDWLVDWFNWFVFYYLNSNSFLSLLIVGFFCPVPWWYTNKKEATPIPIPEWPPPSRERIQIQDPWRHLACQSALLSGLRGSRAFFYGYNSFGSILILIWIGFRCWGDQDDLRSFKSSGFRHYQRDSGPLPLTSRFSHWADPGGVLVHWPFRCCWVWEVLPLSALSVCKVWMEWNAHMEGIWIMILFVCLLIFLPFIINASSIKAQVYCLNDTRDDHHD